MCLWTRRPSLCARAVDAQVRVSSCFCRCTKDLAGFIVTFIFTTAATTILRILRHVFAQLPHGLQLAPVIAAETRMRRGVDDQVLVHALSMAGGGLFVIFWHSRQKMQVTRLRTRSCIWLRFM